MTEALEAAATVLWSGREPGSKAKLQEAIDAYLSHTVSAGVRVVVEELRKRAHAKERATKLLSGSYHQWTRAEDTLEWQAADLLLTVSAQLAAKDRALEDACNKIEATAISMEDAFEGGAPNTVTMLRKWAAECRLSLSSATSDIIPISTEPKP